MSTTSPAAPATSAEAAGAVGASDAPAAAGASGEVSRADRFMLRLLRIRKVDKLDEKSVAGAHRAFRWAIVVSAVRCTITYLLVPLLIPVISIAGVLAAPLNIALCLVAGINGVISLRRFWRTDHRGKWTYTWFISVVFLILIGTLAYEITGLVTS